MEQVSDVVGNPTALLIERLFWFGLGAFFILALLTSLIRGLKNDNHKTTPVYPKQ